MATKAGDILLRVQQLRSGRDPWLDYWQELAETFLPGRAEFVVKKQQGERALETIFDGSPRLAARDLASAIDGLIKPKTSNWFDLTVEDEDVAELEDVKLWLEKVRNLMWRAIYQKDARFIQRSDETDGALVVFGWGVLWMAENRDRNGLLFKSFHNGRVAIDENADGVVDTIVVSDELTALQAQKQFGFDKLHKEIQEIITKGRPQGYSQKFPFSQIVLPNEDYQAGTIGPSGMTFKTAVIDEKHEQIMSEGGFHEFPAAIPRWDTYPGKVYALSPAMFALPDALTLQAMAKTLLIGGERAVDPPIMVPSDSFLSPIRTMPGGISVFDPQPMVDIGLSQPVFPLPVSGNLPVGREMQFDYRAQVEAAFFKNVLKLPIEGQQMTATEILERKEEFVRVLGPVFGRLEADYIGHVVERTFGIMKRAGALPPMPDALQDHPLKFTFQSPIQQARKAIEVAGFSRTLEVMAPLAQVQPELLDNIDGDKIMRDAPEWAGIPSEWLRTQDEVGQVRQDRAQQAQAAAGVSAAQPLARSIKDIASAQQIAATPV